MSSTPGALRGEGVRTGGLLDAVERRLGLTPSGLAVAGGAVCAWPVAYLVGSRVLFLMVYAAAGLLVALAFAGRRALGASARRSEIPLRIREGQTVEVEIEIEARRRLAGIVLEERLERLRQPVRVLVASLSPNEPYRHRYAVTPSLRGVYPIGPLVAVWSDPFGLTRRRTTLVAPQEVIVHPSTETVHDRVLSREWEDPPVRPPVSKPWPHGFEFYGMRDYVSGDDPRRIVWSAVARTDRYLVREAEQGITDRVTILLDTDAKAHAAGDPSETFETAVRAAASLGRMHLDDGFVVTIETPAGRLTSPLRGRRALIPLLDALARVDRGKAPLRDAMVRLAAEKRRDTHHLIVTPRLDLDAAAMLRLLLDRGASVTVVHVATEEGDAESVRRAAALGAEIVELEPGVSLQAMFRRSMGAGIRR